MSHTIRNSGFAIALLFAAAPMLAVHADAKSTFMQDCSAKWKSIKDAGTPPAGMSWKQFVKQSCAMNAAAPSNVNVDTNSNDNAVPAEPTNTSYSNIDVKTVDKNGKPFTPGQIAAHQRIKECAGEWRAAKTAGSLPRGIKWPQFWSSCNTRLKTQS